MLEEQKNYEIENPDNVSDEQAEPEETKVVQELFCVACRRKFKSEGQWLSHERSAKHKKNMEKLIEEVVLDSDLNEPTNDNNLQETTILEETTIGPDILDSSYLKENNGDNTTEKL